MTLSPESLAGYLDGDLSGEERRRVELHLVSCAECRDELAELRRLHAGATRTTWRRRWPLVLVPAAAAAAMLAVLLPRQATVPTATRDGAPADPHLGIVAPPVDGAVAPGPVPFIWRSAGNGASYTLTVQATDGRVIWTATTMDTSVVTPDSVGIARGATWFWYVDALLPDGHSRSTGVQTTRAGP